MIPRSRNCCIPTIVFHLYWIMVRAYTFTIQTKKAYLDFAAGIAVCALGYSNEAYKNALKDQVDKLLHTSNLYYNVPTIEGGKESTKSQRNGSYFLYKQRYGRPLREPSKLQKNMHIPETDMPAMKSLP